MPSSPVMKAVVYERYGPPEAVVQVKDVEKPVPKNDEVLIRVRAASVNPLDAGLMKGKPHTFRLFFGLPKPRLGRPGVDVAGEVEAVGRDVNEFKPGDAVFGSCRGAFAEYACARASQLVRKPGSVTFLEAASAPVAALTALEGLRDHGKIRRGSQVLIHGASGGVGTFAVQIAKSFGAEVTGVCSSRNLRLVRALGADHVVDYTQEDFVDRARRSGKRYDIIFDTYFNHSLSDCRTALAPRGIYVLVGGPPQRWFLGILAPVVKALALSLFIPQKFVTFIAKSNRQDLDFIAGLMASGELRPVIDRTCTLAEAAEAIRYLDQRHARGKVVISADTAAHTSRNDSRASVSSA